MKSRFKTAIGTPTRFLNSISRALSHFSIDHPVVIIAVSLAVALFFTVRVGTLRFETDITNLADGSTEVSRDIERAARDFIIGDPVRLVLVGDATDPSVLLHAKKTAEALRDIQNVFRVETPFDASYHILEGLNVASHPVITAFPATAEEVEAFLDDLSRSYSSKHMISESRDALLFNLFIRGGVGLRGRNAISEAEALLEELWGQENYYLSGEIYLGYSVDRTVIRDVRVLFPMSVMLFSIVILLSFRSVAGLLVIGSTVLFTVFSTLGFMAWRATPLTIVSATLPVLLVALASADGIHVFSRYRESSGEAPDKKTALKSAMNSLAAPIFMTSLTTAAGFAALMTSSVIPVRDFGFYSMFGILAAMLFSLSTLPAILAVLPQPRSRKAKSDSFSLGKLLEFAATSSQKHWKFILAVVTSVVLFSVLGVFRLDFESNLARYFRKGSTVSSGIMEYEERFGGSSMLLIVVDSGDEAGAVQPAFLEMLKLMQNRVESYPLFSRTSSIVSLAEGISPYGLALVFGTVLHGRVGDINVYGYLSRDGMRKAVIHTHIYSAKTSEISQTIGRLESELNKIALPGVRVIVAGTPKVVELHMKEFASSQIKSIIISGGAVWFIVSFLFVSFVVGSLSMVPLCLSVLVNFGIMGIAGIPLDAATILVASISIGVGVDYSIHLLKRLIEDKKRSGEAQELFRVSVRSVGRAIIINTITLFAGFMVFAFSSFLTVAYFGILTAMTLLISCITSLAVIPAILTVPERIRRTAR